MAKKNEETNIPEADMKAVEQQIATMLAEARAEVARIKAEAKAELENLENKDKKAKQREEDAYMNELVEIQLFKDNGRYKDDVFVGVNGETILIKRGERVKIKRKFAEALANSNTQDAQTADLIARQTGLFAKSGF